jgi:hypothetical protein
MQGHDWGFPWPPLVKAGLGSFPPVKFYCAPYPRIGIILYEPLGSCVRCKDGLTALAG